MSDWVKETFAGNKLPDMDLYELALLLDEAYKAAIKLEEVRGREGWHGNLGVDMVQFICKKFKMCGY